MNDDTGFTRRRRRRRSGRPPDTSAELPPADAERLTVVDGVTLTLEELGILKTESMRWHKFKTKREGAVVVTPQGATPLPDAVVLALARGGIPPESAPVLDNDEELRGKRQPRATPKRNKRKAPRDKQPAIAQANPLPVSDFIAFSPDHTYIHRPTGEPWTATAVNARVEPIEIGGGQKELAANVWLDRNDAVEQRTWAPGEPQIIENKLVAEGGFFAKQGARVFNLYNPPFIIPARNRQISFWRDRLYALWPEQAVHIERWKAHRAQRPGEKINHALVLGGKPGIGKDAVLDPLKTAVGAWNFAEISPQAVLGNFNEFARSVVLRISEGKDLGDIDRFAFYEATKTLTRSGSTRNTCRPTMC